MENSAIDAILIGVNVFIFIIALTFAIMLMSTVLDMSNAASEVVKTTENSSILESIGSVDKKVITGTEFYKYYLKYVEYNEGNKESLKYMLYILRKGEPEKLLDQDTEIKKSDLNATFVINYEGLVGDKIKYVFSADEE